VPNKELNFSIDDSDNTNFAIDEQLLLKCLENFENLTESLS